jgi:phosphocarrier protein HPr
MLRADMSAATPAPAARPRVSREVTVLNKQGVHARPSASFVKLASTFGCDVFLEKDGETINGKSIMGLLMLAAGPGSKLRIICEGGDAETALAALVALVNGKFGEE